MQNIKQPIGTTIRYGWLDLLDWFDRQNMPRIIIVIILLAIVTGVSLIGRIQSEHTAAAVPTPSLPIIIIATAPAIAVPVPAVQVAYQQPVRWVTAWAAPDGVVLGTIPEPSMNAITGRYGDGWVSTTWQGNTVWIRVSDLGGSLVDIGPAPTAQTIYVSVPAAPQQPIAADPVYRADSAAQPATAPQVAPDEWTPEQDRAYRAQIGLSDEDMRQALTAHNIQQLESCDRGLISNAEYCNQVRAARAQP